MQVLSPSIIIALFYFNSFACVVTFLSPKINGRTAADTAFKICLKVHVAFLRSSHKVFPPSVSFKSMWCNHTVVLILQ